MKNYGSFKKAVLLSASMLMGISVANAHTTPLTATVLNDCDSMTQFAKNAEHNDAQVSNKQMKSYVDARIACQIQHQDQHVQSDKYFVNEYGSERDQQSRITPKDSAEHQEQHIQSDKYFVNKYGSERNQGSRITPKNTIQHQDQHLQSEKYFTNQYGSERNQSPKTIIKD